MKIKPSVASPLALSFFLAVIAIPVWAEGSVPRFEPADCPNRAAMGSAPVDCGYLVVPLDREHPDGRTLRLAVAVLRSSSPHPKPDPVVFLAGGPGAGALKDVPSVLRSGFWNRLRSERDLVFWDQRGTGYSEPEFCPEFDEAYYTSDFRGLSGDEVTRVQVEAARKCHEKLAAEGFDFDAFTTSESARDLDDLRRALGYDRWNLYGISYGTRLALEAMREVPTGIRSALLDSTYPFGIHSWVDAPDRFTRSLDLVFEQCAKDPACHAEFPKLEDDLYEALAERESQPITLPMSNREKYPEGELVVDGSLLATGVFQGLYNPLFTAILPTVIREAKRGNAAVLRGLATGLVEDPHHVDYALYFDIECYETAPFNPPEEIAAEQARYPRLAPWYQRGDNSKVCDAWGGHRADRSLAEPVQSDIPALIVGGELDPITPPAYGRLAAETLPNSTFVEVRGLGHGAARFTDCTRSLVYRFFDDPAQKLDTSCAAEIPPVHLYTDIRLLPGLTRLLSEVDAGGGTLPLAALGVAVLLLVSGVVVWPLAAFVRRLQKRPGEAAGGARLARWLAGLAGLAGLGFLVGLGLATLRALRADPFVLALGLPGRHAALFALPWIVLVLTVCVLALAVNAWRRGWWGAGARVHYTLVTVGCLLLVGFVAWWGFW